MNRRVAFLILDGMSESIAQGSSLALARTPLIDWLAATGKMGFYQPDIGVGDTEPKTDVVVPAFLGLSASLNPGRATLELCDHGYNPEDGEYACTLRMSENVEGMPQHWSMEKGITETLSQELLHVAIKAAGHQPIAVRLSLATRYGTRLLVGKCSKKICDAVIKATAQRAAELNLQFTVQDHYEVPAGCTAVKGSQSHTLFIGWAKGSLRGAFKLLGATVNPFTRTDGDYGNWSKYEENFEQWCRPVLERSIDKFDCLVFYTKKTAFASRNSDRSRKVQAIEWMDKMMYAVCHYLSQNDIIVVIADHSADFGGWTNPVQHTCYVVASWDASRFQQRNVLEMPNFCEEAILAKQGNMVIPQATLCSLIHHSRMGP